MRAVPAWALYCALAVLAVAAAVDALRVESPVPAPPPPIRAEAPRLQTRCPEAAIASLRGEGGVIPCRRRAPAGAPEPHPRV